MNAPKDMSVKMDNLKTFLKEQKQQEESNNKQQQQQQQSSSTKKRPASSAVGGVAKKPAARAPAPVEEEEEKEEGSKKNAARAFKRLLDQGVVPDDVKELYQSLRSRAETTELVQGVMKKENGSWTFDHESQILTEMTSKYSHRWASVKKRTYPR
eukprot:6155478-Amphidinium_carterae.1